MLIGADIGTSGSKAILMREDGLLLASHREPYDIDSPRPGQAEQDPEMWVEKTSRCIKAVATGHTHEISGISFSGQMHGIVPVGKSSLPVRNAILWADSRSSHEARDIPVLIGPETFLRTTMNRVAPGYGLATLLWLARHEPHTLSATTCIFCPKDYVRFRLGGDPLQELSDASGTCCLDIKREDWAWEILTKLGLPTAIFPPLARSTALAGVLNDHGSRLCGLPAGIPLYCGGADNALSGIGSGLIDDTRFGINIGTGGQVGTAAAQPVFDAAYRTSTFCHPIPGRWNIYGATLAAGLSLKWFRETFCPHSSFAELDALAARVAPGANGLLFLPYLNGERTPWMDPDARGVFFGLSTRHGLAEMCRAVLEGVTYALEQSGSLLAGMGLHARSLLSTGGGATSPLWAQIQADVFGLPVQAVRSGDACVGAAILAGVGSGVYETIAEGCAVAVGDDGTSYDPTPRAHGFYSANKERFRELYLAAKTLFKENIPQ